MTTSELRTDYWIFVGLGFTVILLGVFEMAPGIAAHPWTSVRGSTSVVSD